MLTCFLRKFFCLCRVAGCITLVLSFLIYYCLTLFAEKRYPSSGKPEELSHERVKTAPRDKFAKEQVCNLPVLNPWDPSIKPLIYTPPPYDCKTDHPLLFKTDFESNLIQLEEPRHYGLFNCCYQPFHKIPEQENKIIIDPTCTPIQSPKTKISNETEFLRVACFQKLKNGTVEKKIVDFFGLVNLKPEVEARIAGLKKWGNGAVKKTVNVVILGIDAMSHMNFIREMPLTYEFITKNLSAIGMRGYSKIGDNTFPNIMPVLTGLSESEVRNSCWTSKSMPFDDCPFIWKKFSANGYRTAYSEDAVKIAAFTYHKPGFNRTPTDYYFGTLLYHVDKGVGHKSYANANICYGPRLGVTLSYDFLQKMALAMNKTRRYFQFTWTTSLTHDVLTIGRQADLPLLQTLTWFQNEGYLENTVFILMSDHGLRWGNIRNTLQGRFEARLPLLYLILPAWFREQYRPAVSNLINNQYRLSSHFDLHETLLDLLDLKRIGRGRLRSRYSHLEKKGNKVYPRGISLFLPIPLQRTCEDAAIPDHWCICRKTIPVRDFKDNALVLEGARNVVHYINRMLSEYPQCRTLKLKSVERAEVFQSRHENMSDSSFIFTDSRDMRLETQAVTFTLSIIVKPSRAAFEATVTRQTDGVWLVSRELSRINKYGEQSRCVTDYDLKKFCYCKRY